MNDLAPKKGSVVIFKLINGQEIIGRCKDVKIDDHFMVTAGLENVREIGLTQDWKIQLAPYILSASDAIITFNMDSVAASVRNIPADLEAEYLSATTKIKLADKPGLII